MPRNCRMSHEHDIWKPASFHLTRLELYALREPEPHHVDFDETGYQSQ